MRGKLFGLVAAAAAIGFSPSAAQAATVVGPAATVSSCTNFTFSVTIISCAGGYSGNMLQDSLTDPIGIAAVVALGGSNTGTFLEPKLDKGLSDQNGGTINFNTLLNGLTIFGLHAGGAGDGGQGTFFFSFNANNTDVITVTDRLNSNSTGLSNAALFKTGSGAVPEPATWAMMLFGFGGVGFAMRRRKSEDVTKRMRFANA
ncbi:MAG: PEPxxWA-CTERM sorting domain-containing protein [Croceibacterium sp.]